MTSAPIVTGHEPANDDLSVRDAMSYVSNQRLVKHRALSRAATALKWAGHFVAGVALMFVFSGSGLWTLVVAIAGALVGTLASALANNLGLPGSLEGVRVENVLTPVCLSVPYHARIRDLPKKHPPYGQDCCLVVVRDGHALGIHVGADVPAGAAGSSSDTTVEQQMQPVSWVEAVEIDEDAIGALERMKRYRRSFLPVLKRHRLVGIIHRDRVLEAAQLSQSRVRGARRDGVKK